MLFRSGDGVKTILVTGKENKTIVKGMLVRVLETKSRVLTPADGEHLTTAPWQALHPSQDYCVLELRRDHPLGSDAIDLIRPDLTVCTDTYKAENLLPCPGLAFGGMQSATAVVLEAAMALGFDRETVANVVKDYAPTELTTARLTADGVNITIHNACKSAAMAESVLAAADGGLKIAVTVPAYEAIFAPWADKLYVVDEEHPLLAVEKELLEVLEDGASLVLCGDRNDDMAFLLRRVFGIHNGFLYGGS